MATVKNNKPKTSTKGRTNNTGSKKVGRPKSVRQNKSSHYTQDDPNRALYHDEITLIITLVVSLLLILSNFNLSGKVGDFISDITFGCFGFLAYLLPFFLFFGVAFHIANRGNKTALRKLISGVVLSIVLAALIQLIFSEYSGTTKIIEYYTDSAEAKNGGGIIGGIICRLLHPLFGTVGTFIVLIASMIVFMMFITGKALFAYLGSKSKESLELMRERKLEREENYSEVSEESEDEIMERRPARTVVLKKKESHENEEKAGGSFLKSKKKTKNAAKNESVELEPDNSFNMEEIKIADVDIPIQRASSNQEITSQEDRNKTYEEQLQLKFGKNSDNISTQEVTPFREGIDEDIQRLLRAAGEDTDINAYQSKTQDSIAQDTILDDSSINNMVDLNDVDTKEKYPNDNGITKDSIDKKEDNRSNVSSNTSTDKVTNTNKEKNNTLHNSSDNSLAEIEELSKSQILEEKKEYVFPPIDLLTKPKADVKGMSDKDLKETAMKLQKTLESFGVRVTITNVSCGPSVTRYELQPEQGVKVSRITGLADDIKLNLAAADVRIEAPIPGKAAVGIEVPNKDNTMVLFREIIENKNFKSHPSDIAFAVGKDIGGQTIVTDIAKMPHLLIAGATGSGKSVCINTLIMSILYKAKPSDVRMIMVDPKVVELSVYNGIPHLLIPVVTDPKKASAALNWAVMEMTERYNKFAELGVRDIKGYNEKVALVKEYQNEKYQKMPQIVIIVDELADLMMVAPGEVEDAICRLAQMARAAGLHLIIATQRPSVNVITGLIKANVPSRIAFSVSSSIDSRTIIDGSGAEKLLGKGDMLFFPSGYPKPIRVQGAFVSDKEVGAVVEFLTAQNSTPVYSEDIANKITSVQTADSSGTANSNDRDEYFIEAGKFIIDKDKASIGMLQRVYKIGFNRAARIMDQLAEAGVVGQEEGTKPRKVLMSLEEFEEYVDEYV